MLVVEEAGVELIMLLKAGVGLVLTKVSLLSLYEEEVYFL